MIFTHFKLTNFGPHRVIDFDCAAPMVGLLGPNGSGKSNVLAALKYLLTGEADENLETYIYHGATSATVEGEFIKGGRTGRLMRQIGGSRKRLLEWGDQKETSAAGVQALLTKILGNNKTTIANAVFIDQGKLSQILFPTSAVDKRSLFIQLVDLGHCALRANQISTHIDRLQATLVDLGPALDVAAQQVQSTGQAWQQAKTCAESLPDVSADIAACNQAIRRQDLLRSFNAQLADLQVRETETQLSLANVLTRWPAKSYEQAARDFELLETALTLRQKQYEQWLAVKHALVTYRQLYGAWEKAEALRLAAQETWDYLGTTHPNPELSIPHRVVKARAGTRAARDYEQLQRDVKNEQVRQQALLKGVEEAQAAFTLDPEQLAQERQTLVAEEALLDMAEDQLDKRRHLFECLQKDTKQVEDGQLTCTKCGLKIADPGRLDAVALAADEEHIRLSRAALKQRKAAWSDRDRACTKQQAEITSAQHELVLCQMNLQKFEARLAQAPAATVAEAEAELDEALALQQQMLMTKQQLEKANGELTRLAEDMAALKLTPEAIADPTYTDAEAEAKRSELEQRRQAVTAKRLLKAQLDKAKASTDADARTRVNLEAQRQTLEQQLEEPLPPAVVDAAQACNGDLTKVLSGLQAQHDARSEAAGVAAQAKKTFQDSQREHQELLARQEKDRVKRELVSDLLALKNEFKPEGLPMAVVNYHFGKLVKLTQEALNEMEPNFAVQLAPEEPMAMTFTRLDDPPGTPAYEPMPVSKLSGGQKVRLSLAFLIAVQRRLVRDVGLLILDEPSTHVDADGVEQLADFLEDVGKLLAGSEMQTWASDHHPALRRAFSKCLQLGPAKAV